MSVNTRKASLKKRKVLEDSEDEYKDEGADDDEDEGKSSAICWTGCADRAYASPHRNLKF